MVVNNFLPYKYVMGVKRLDVHFIIHAICVCGENTCLWPKQKKEGEMVLHEER